MTPRMPTSRNVAPTTIAAFGSQSGVFMGFSFVSGRDDERLGCCLLHAGVEPGELPRGLLVAAAGDLEQLGVAQPLGSLGDDGPRRLDERPEHVQVLQVAQQADLSRADLGEAVGM